MNLIRFDLDLRVVVTAISFAGLFLLYFDTSIYVKYRCSTSLSSWSTLSASIIPALCQAAAPIVCLSRSHSCVAVCCSQVIMPVEVALPVWCCRIGAAPFAPWSFHVYGSVDFVQDSVGDTIGGQLPLYYGTQSRVRSGCELHIWCIRLIFKYHVSIGA